MLWREALQSYHQHVWAVWLWCDNDEESLFGRLLLTSRRYTNKQIKRLLCQQSQAHLIVSLFSNRSSFSVLLFDLLPCSGVRFAISYSLNTQMVWILRTFYAVKLDAVLFHNWHVESTSGCGKGQNYWRIFSLLHTNVCMCLLTPFDFIRFSAYINQ